MTRTVEFTIRGKQKIHCASCEHRIVRALGQLGGVEQVRASVEDQRVVATIDSGQVTPEQLRQKLGELGYLVASPGGVG